MEKLQMKQLEIAKPEMGILGGISMESLAGRLRMELVKTEVEVVTQVLEQLLKREPVLEDFKRLGKRVKPGTDGYLGYFLYFDSVKVGTVRFVMPEMDIPKPPKYEMEVLPKVEFRPLQKWM